MNMRGRISRLEKRAGVGVYVDDPDAMTDTEFLVGLRTMFRTDPERRWEEVLPTMGYSLSQILAEVRMASSSVGIPG